MKNFTSPKFIILHDFSSSGGEVEGVKSSFCHIHLYSSNRDRLMHPTTTRYIYRDSLCHSMKVSKIPKTQDE